MFTASILKSLWCDWLRASQKVKVSYQRLNRLRNGWVPGFVWPYLCKAISMLIAFSGICSGEGY